MPWIDRYDKPNPYDPADVQRYIEQQKGRKTTIVNYPSDEQLKKAVRDVLEKYKDALDHMEDK